MNEKFEFLLIVDSTFNILSKGVLVTGEVLEGQIKKGDEVEIRGNDAIIKSKCIRIERHLREITEAQQGEYVGIYLADVSRYQLSRGMRVFIPT